MTNCMYCTVFVRHLFPYCTSTWNWTSMTGHGGGDIFGYKYCWQIIFSSCCCFGHYFHNIGAAHNLAIYNVGKTQIYYYYYIIFINCIKKTNMVTWEKQNDQQTSWSKLINFYFGAQTSTQLFSLIVANYFANTVVANYFANSCKLFR